jgi:hypothetical protein
MVGKFWVVLNPTALRCTATLELPIFAQYPVSRADIGRIKRVAGQFWPTSGHRVDPPLRSTLTYVCGICHTTDQDHSNELLSPRSTAVIPWTWPILPLLHTRSTQGVRFWLLMLLEEVTMLTRADMLVRMRSCSRAQARGRKHEAGSQAFLTF